MYLSSISNECLSSIKLVSRGKRSNTGFVNQSVREECADMHKFICILRSDYTPYNW